MDFVLDYISVSTFWTILSIFHALLAVALLGALTHQAAAVLAPPRAGATGGFVTHFRSVSGPRYAAAVCVLWVLVFIFGGWIYTRYRFHVRVLIEQEALFKTLGAFEVKEHVATIGLGLLPAYWHFWIATSALGASILGLLAAALPEKIRSKIPLALAWITPVALLPVLIYSLKFYWRWE